MVHQLLCHKCTLLTLLNRLHDAFSAHIQLWQLIIIHLLEAHTQLLTAQMCELIVGLPDKLLRAQESVN